MATLVPSLNGCLPRMTPGERRFARLLESHLEDDYLCWYEVPVGIRPRYTDFIVLHPGRGLLLLEVKDWKLGTIHTADRRSFTLRLQSGEKRVSHPLEQVRQCTYHLVRNLERDPTLRHGEGEHAGRLVCPYAFGVVLTEITRAEFEAHDFERVLPPHLVVCKDEMSATADVEAFQTRLWNMFSHRFRTPLTLPQIERVRWHLFPEIRIEPPVQPTLFDSPNDGSGVPEVCSEGTTPEEDPVDSLFPDVVRLMDVKQERLARSLGTGHRVIHGVAGSGKTLILGYRCAHLASLVAKPILVICFNVTLAAWLRESMAERGLAERVHVRHFHDWCGDQLRSYHVERPPNGPGYVEASVRRVIEAVAGGRIPRAQYGAVMIDEGHDFEPDWLRLVVSMVDPDSDSVLLLYDDAQSIYSGRRELGFSLKSVGVRAQGRTTVLRLNYRNTEEILSFAYRFAREWLVPEEADEDGVPLVAPESGGRHGPEPAVRLLADHDAEASLVARTAVALHARGTAWAEMAILYPESWMGERLARELDRHGAPFHWLKRTSDKKMLSRSDDRVKLMTIHSSKGLEFPFVAVAGVGRLPRARADVASEAKLLYVAMTRATERLMVTAHERNAFVDRLVA